MGTGFYRFGRAAFAIPRLACIRELVLDRARAERSGPFILACSHLSHLEPMFVSSVVRRQVRWMARMEFYRPPLAAICLNWGGAFSVDRFGNAGPAVRRAIRLLQTGEVVGIFPEGGVALGAESALRGAEIKHGVCTISIATGAPVIPVVVLGTQQLNSVRPWLPTRSGRVSIAFGQDVLPPDRAALSIAAATRKSRRREMALRVRAGFVETYQHLLHESGLRDDQIG